MTWKDFILAEAEKDYFKSLRKFLNEEKRKGKTIYPQSKDVFNAFKACPFENLKVCIIGQDPYHGPNQAHGLCFSVRKGVRPPPSLKNILKEWKDDLGYKRYPTHGNLLHWARQGVLLLNTVLTVERGKPLSHSKKGWEIFTNNAVRFILENKPETVFILWGQKAQRKAESAELKLEAAHPSPYSVNNFLGCRHFSKCNELLEKQGKTPIDWRL